MKFSFVGSALRVGFFSLLVVAAPWAAAQAAMTAAAVTDPAAPVPPVAYRSVFADTPTGVEQDSTDWRKANADVGQFKRGHVDILKWEAQQGMPAAPSAPAAPPAPPAAMGHKH